MISIILIHYHAPELILNAIQSVLKYGGFDKNQIEFIIVDNSQNFDQKRLTLLNINYTFHTPGYNSGFARAVNYGIKSATGDIIVLMNQDACITEENTLKRMVVKSLTLPEKCILGCNLKDENGNFQESVWIDSPGLKREWRFGSINQKLNPNWQAKFKDQKRKAHTKSGFVHRINGAFLLIPIKDRKNINDILFDEDFFLYGEDIEWALRIKKKGWNFYHIAEINVLHLGSASSPNVMIKSAQITISDWLVLRKYFGSVYLMLYFLLYFSNKKLEKMLFLFYKFRKGDYPIVIYYSHNLNLKLIKYLFKKYAWQITRLKKISTTDSFLLNCYHNDEKYISEIQKIQF